MPGFLEESKKSLDILFDLTPDDDKGLRESALLQLINYGQVQQPIEVPGADGTKYKIDIALLWDEDYVDILKKTTAYSNDPVLRIKLLRRLKLHKAIQAIHGTEKTYDYTNKSDPMAQRQLWAVLCRMAEVQVDVLHSKYEQIEMERNINVTNAITALNKTLDATSTLLKKPSNSKPETNKQVEETKAQEHSAMVQDFVDAPKELAESVVEAVEGKTQAQPQVTIQSPKQV